MSIFDDIKSKLPFGRNDDSYGYDEGYEDEYYEGEDGYVGEPSYRPASDSYNDSYGSSTASEPQSMGVLGQTHRGEAESVAVYTRSGQPVGDSARHASAYNPPARSADSRPAYRPGAYDTPTSYAESLRTSSASQTRSMLTQAESHAADILSATPQLPAYILRPESYDDVETVVRRVRTKQPVALVFVNVKTEVAKRVLDFSYGFACGSGASVKEVGDRVFMVLPRGCDVKESDLAKLRSEGYLKR